MKKEKKNDNALFYKQAALLAFRSGGYLSVNKALVKAIGFLPAGIFCFYLECYSYFLKNNKLVNEDWFYVTHEYISEKLNILEYTVRKNKVYLQNELHIIQTKMMGLPAKEYIKINFANLFGSLGTDINNINLELNNSNPDPNFSGGLAPNFSGGLYNKNISNKDIKENIKRNFLDLFPEEFQKDKTFQTAINEYITHRKEKGKNLTELSCQKLAKKLSTFSIPICIEAINTTIENGWVGIFPESVQMQRRTNQAGINTSNRSRHNDNVPKMKYKE